MSHLRMTEPEAYYALRVRAGELSQRDPALLADTLREIVAVVPEIGQLINDDVELVLNAPAEQRTAVLADIAKFAAHREEFSTPLRKHARDYVERYCGEFIDCFNRSSPKKVLFLSARPYFQILREARALKKKGYTTAIIYLAQVNDDIAELLRDSFDFVLQLPENLLMLGNILSALEVRLLHIQCWMHNYTLPLSRYVLEHKGAAKAVCEFYDLLSIYSDQSALETYDPDLAEFNFEIDRYVWTHGDGFIVRAPELAQDDLRARYKFKAPIIEMHPYPDTDFIRYRDNSKYRPGATPRIVLAGSLMPRKSDGSIHWPRYAAGGGSLAAVESILRQGLDVTVFHDPHKPLNHPDFSSYFDMVKSRDNFHLMNGVAPDKLSDILKDFDFGISLAAYNFEEVDIRPLHFKTAVGTKLFAYLEAGLPVIVNKENEYVAELVETNGLGIVVHTTEFNEISERIAAFDYLACVGNIRAFNQKHSMEKEIGRLETLYHNLQG